jgi:hypothetical protein
MLLISIVILATPSKFLRSTYINPLNFLKVPVTFSANKTGIEKFIELFLLLTIHFSKAKEFAQKNKNKNKYLIN